MMKETFTLQTKTGRNPKYINITAITFAFAFWPLVSKCVVFVSQYGVFPVISCSKMAEYVEGFSLSNINQYALTVKNEGSLSSLYHGTGFARLGHPEYQVTVKKRAEQSLYLHTAHAPLPDSTKLYLHLQAKPN